MARIRYRTLAALLLGTALVACGPKDKAKNLDSLDNELVGANAADPALTGALHDQIMVDPTLAQQANGDAIRPPGKPYSAEVPPGGAARGGTAGNALTLGALAARQKFHGAGDCAARVHYSASWATRLPKDLPLYPGAQVSEAAGTQDGGCALRVVSFSSGDKLAKLIDWYSVQAKKAGYSADRQIDGDQHVLGGTRGDDAYVLFLKDRAGGGSDVDLVANNGT